MYCLLFIPDSKNYYFSRNFIQQISVVHIIKIRVLVDCDIVLQFS